MDLAPSFPDVDLEEALASKIDLVVELLEVAPKADENAGLGFDAEGGSTVMYGDDVGLLLATCSKNFLVADGVFEVAGADFCDLAGGFSPSSSAMRFLLPLFRAGVAVSDRGSRSVPRARLLCDGSSEALRLPRDRIPSVPLGRVNAADGTEVSSSSSSRGMPCEAFHLDTTSCEGLMLLNS